MKILVVNGSPKGKYSVTLHTSLYLQAIFAEQEFDLIHVGATIKAIEKDFAETKKKLEWADVILFSYPVYTFIAPSQLHRLIELMKDNRVNVAGKYATQITTSKHFYDITAHNYIMENCQDLGLKFIKGLSADMDDLPKKEGQKTAEEFFRYLIYSVEKDLYEAFPEKAPAPAHKPVTVPASADELSPSENNASKGSAVNKTIPSKDKMIALVCDLSPEDTQLKNMIERFRAVIPYRVRLVNIHEFDFKGGCISCFNCSTKGECIYQDGFDKLLREQIQTCNGIVLAFTIRDHSMGALFKTYDDRQFCNGHRTVTMGMPFGYLISGDYSREQNLRLIVEGRAEVGGNFLAGVATDEQNPDREIDKLCERLTYAVEHKYVQPSNFLGVGGMKIFRDLIWLMQGMMRADHKFYKAHNQYDFPQKKRGTMMLMYLVGALMGNEKLKKKMGNNMNEGMISPYRKVVENAGK